MPLSAPQPDETVKLHASRSRKWLGSLRQPSLFAHCSERFVRRLVAERRISYVKLGRYVRLQWSALDAFSEAGRAPSD